MSLETSLSWAWPLIFFSAVIVLLVFTCLFFSANGQCKSKVKIATPCIGSCFHSHVMGWWHCCSCCYLLPAPLVPSAFVHTAYCKNGNCPILTSSHAGSTFRLEETFFYLYCGTLCDIWQHIYLRWPSPRCVCEWFGRHAYCRGWVGGRPIVSVVCSLLFLCEEGMTIARPGKAFLGPVLTPMIHVRTTVG